MGVCACHSNAKEPVPANNSKIVPTTQLEKQLLMARKLECAPALRISGSAIYQRRKLDPLTEESDYDTTHVSGI